MLLKPEAKDSTIRLLDKAQETFDVLASHVAEAAETGDTFRLWGLAEALADTAMEIRTHLQLVED